VDQLIAGKRFVRRITGSGADEVGGRGADRSAAPWKNIAGAAAAHIDETTIGKPGDVGVNHAALIRLRADCVPVGVESLHLEGRLVLPADNEIAVGEKCQSRLILSAGGEAVDASEVDPLRSIGVINAGMDVDAGAKFIVSGSDNETPVLKPQDLDIAIGETFIVDHCR